MTTLLLALALQSSDLLKPLVPVVQKVEQGLNEVLKGASAEETLKPWRASVKDGAVDSWKGVASLRNVGLELEIIFLKGEAGLYRLKTFAAFDGDKPFFVVFEGDESDSTSGEPASAYVGDAAPFREAAEAIVAAARAKDASGITFADDEWFDATVPAEIAEEGRNEVRESREKLEAVLAAVAALDYDSIRIKVDEQAFIARDEGGKIVGVVECEWEFGEKDGPALKIGPFHSLDE